MIVTATSTFTGDGPGHFCLALHVAMQIGPYLHHLVRRCSAYGLWGFRAPEGPAFPADFPHRSDCHWPRGQYLRILGRSSI